MSLINTMLRDLENRRAAELGQRDWQREIRSLPTAQSSTLPLPLVLVVGGMVIAVSVAAGWYWSASSRLPDQERLPPTTLSLAAADHRAETPVPLPPALPEPEVRVESVRAADADAAARARKEKRSDKRAVKGEALPALKVLPLPAPVPAPVSVPETKPALPLVAPPTNAEGRGEAAKPSTEGIVKTPAPLSAHERAELEFRRGQGLLSGGARVEAVAAFHAALALDPLYGAPRQTLARLLTESNRQDEAAALLAEGLALQPAQIGWAMMLARSQMEKGDAAAAGKILLRSQPHAGNSADYAGFQGYVEYRQSHFAKAVERYRVATSLSANEGKWWFGLAQALEGDGKAQDAKEAYRRAMASGNLQPSLATQAEQKLR